MSCNSVLYAANTSTQTLAIGDAVDFGGVVRRYGKNINISGGRPYTIGAGYYKIIANVNFSAAEGEVTVSLLKDGLPITGAEATITAAATTNYNVTIPAIVRNVCCKDSEITAVITGAASTVINASIAIEKL